MRHPLIALLDYGWRCWAGFARGLCLLSPWRRK